MISRLVSDISSISDIAFSVTGSHTGYMQALDLADLAVPNEEMTASAANAVQHLVDYLRRHPTPSGRVVLCVDDAPETTIAIPSEAFRLFIDLLNQLAQGNAVNIAPVHAELTTQQAAELLGVSRPYLVKILESGEIPFRKVGTHRRVRLLDILEYQQRDDKQRDSVARQLTEEAEELGLYEG